MPLGIVLEFHGWWHILTAMSSYTFMAMIEFLTSADNDNSHGLGFKWPAKAVLEHIAPKRFAEAIVKGDVTANGHMNGYVNNRNMKKRRN